MSSAPTHGAARLCWPAILCSLAIACGATTVDPQNVEPTQGRAQVLSTRPTPDLNARTAAAADAYDTNCDAMDAQPVTLGAAEAGAVAYFDEVIPRRLHQIWYGEPKDIFERRMQWWAHYAEAFGYAYKRWGETDDDLVAQLMPSKNWQLFMMHREDGNYKSASDVLRLSLLDIFGGIYLDSDLAPPFDEDGFFDLDTWLPMRNIAAIAEGGAPETYSAGAFVDRGSRETDSVGAFLTNCFLMASPGHPLIHHLVRTLPTNERAWRQRFLPVAEYVTGPYFLTKSWAGPLTVLGMNEGFRYHLFGGAHGDPAPFRPGDGPRPGAGVLP